MLKYIARRLAMLVIVVIGVTLITFTMMHLAPGDPAELIATARYGMENLTEEDVERIRVAEGLDAPVFIQYLRWLGHTVEGGFWVASPRHW
ncbi:ABC transporter permease family protein [Syntrophaceticus schinkii]|uniref:hypothetical protein n=1 Tax=Syntrophaceticus schinkii TaxID=499207 RepID=UPI001E2FB7A9|nr:hypothetical protein [Syntrophaceticus schinkii]